MFKRTYHLKPLLSIMKIGGLVFIDFETIAAFVA